MAINVTSRGYIVIICFVIACFDTIPTSSFVSNEEQISNDIYPSLYEADFSPERISYSPALSRGSFDWKNAIECLRQLPSGIMKLSLPQACCDFLKNFGQKDTESIVLLFCRKEFRSLKKLIPQVSSRIGSDSAAMLLVELTHSPSVKEAFEDLEKRDATWKETMDRLRQSGNPSNVGILKQLLRCLVFGLSKQSVKYKSEKCCDYINFPLYCSRSYERDDQRSSYGISEKLYKVFIGANEGNFSVPTS